MKKLLLSTMCSIGLLLPYASPIFADSYYTDENVGYLDSTQEFMQYIVLAKNNLTINSSGVANITCSVAGKSGVNKTEITSNLQQYKDNKWVTIATWKGSGTKSCSMNKSKSVAKGYSYRVSSTVKAYIDSKSETKSIVSDTRKY
ncbi:MAG: hypothetical protein ACRCXT_14565 [Paraclostridium sp.]